MILHQKTNYLLVRVAIYGFWNARRAHRQSSPPCQIEFRAKREQVEKGIQTRFFFNPLPEPADRF